MLQLTRSIKWIYEQTNLWIGFQLKEKEKIKIKKKNYCRRIWCQKFHWKPKSHCSSELRESSSIGLKVDTTGHDHPCKFYFGRSAMESMEPIINISWKELSKEKCDHLFTFFAKKQRSFIHILWSFH